MGHILAVVVGVLCAVEGTEAFDKQALDLHGAAKAAGLSQVGPSREFSQGGLLEMSLIEGGYFTLGTLDGIDEGPLDDQCQLSFGHPYAKTSYPIIKVDGQWYRFDGFFTEAADIANSENGLSWSSRSPSGITAELALSSAQGSNVQLTLKLGNSGEQAVEIGLGLVFDPALGKWGDGSVALGGSFLQTESAFGVGEIPLPLTIWEKANGAKGLGLDLFFGAQQPVQVMVANWPNIYQDPQPGLVMATQDQIYDLGIEVLWEDLLLNPNQEREYQVFFSIKIPDFPQGPFMRWDLPRSFKLTDNLMFPRDFSTFVEIANPANSDLSARLDVEFPPILSTDQAEFSLSLGRQSQQYQRLNLHSRLVFEDQVAEARLRLVDGGNVVDVLHRPVFFPATPVSDTGLTVTIDSLDLSEFPLVGVRFDARTTADQVLITELSDENIFLYESGGRIGDFSLGIDTSTGAASADIVFVLDVTGSMGDEISAVKQNIIEFADSLSFRRIDFQLGMVTFLDEVENVYPFTNDPQAFRRTIEEQFPHQGGDIPENSLEALEAGANFDFRPQAKRILVWITDANYHVENRFTSLTPQGVTNKLLAVDAVVHVVGNPNFKQVYYDPITLATGGLSFDINGNFRDILLEIARIEVSGNYLLSYLTPQPDDENRVLELEVRYAGLGGRRRLEFSPLLAAGAGKMVFYPNPFNPQITFLVDKRAHSGGQIEIFDILGQRVRRFELEGAKIEKIVWDGQGNNGSRLASGVYFVRLRLHRPEGGWHQESARVLYLK